MAAPASALSTDDGGAVRAEQERAYARHASEPWYDAAVRALAEQDEGWDEQADEETWPRVEPADRRSDSGCAFRRDR